MGLFDQLLSTVTGGLIPSHDERVAHNAQDASKSLAETQASQFGDIYKKGQEIATSGGGTLSALGPNPFLQLLQTGGTNNPLLQQYGNAAGLNLPGVSTPPGFIPGTNGGGYTAARGGFVPNVARPGVAGGPVNPSTAGAQPSNGAGGVNGQPPVEPALKKQMDAYGLTQAQQVEANREISRISMRAKSHTSQFTARMSQQGVDPNLIAEGQARIQATYDGLAETTLADFAEKARATKEQALQTLMSLGLSAYDAERAYGQSQQQTGLQTEESATIGLTNPQGAQNQIAQQAQAQSAANNAALMQLATAFLPGGAFAGGGIGGMGTPPIAGVGAGAAGGDILGGIALGA